MIKKTSAIINWLYILIVIFFLLDGFTPFDIRSQLLKSIIYFGFLIGAPLVLFWNLSNIDPPIKKLAGIIYPAIFVIVVIFLQPTRILAASGAWRTQTIVYEHGHLFYLTVEFQMQDIGGRGYNRRTVEVFNLTPLFAISTAVPADIDNKAEWIRVDKDVNELGLKYP